MFKSLHHLTSPHHTLLTTILYHFATYMKYCTTHYTMYHMTLFIGMKQPRPEPGAPGPRS